MRAFALTLILAVVAGVAAAQETASMFALRGDRLVVGPDVDGDNWIEEEHADAFVELLRQSDGVRVVELNSGGGSLWAAQRMSDAIVDFALDTHVHGECASSCALIFLGGETRTMSRGSRIGFHQNWWAASDIEDYYEESAEHEGWATPFEFAAWMYNDTQREAYEQLVFMVRRGVDPLFAIETLKTPSEGMWYPYRIRLLAAGVLTE